jgi:hypothetical protein
MKVTHVNATPRSRVFKYYYSAAGQTGGGGGGSAYVPPNIPEQKDEINVADTL